MTSDVKGWGELFFPLPPVFSLLYRQSRSQEDPTVAHAESRGWAPTFLASVGCLPHARDERPWRPLHAAEGDTPPGRRLCRERGETATACAALRRPLAACGGTTPWVALAPRQALHARARATTTCGAGWPGALRWRDRGPSRPGAGPRSAWSAVGRCARRRGRGRLPCAGPRDAQAPSTSARRAGLVPVFGRRPG